MTLEKEGGRGGGEGREEERDGPSLRRDQLHNVRVECSH